MRALNHCGPRPKLRRDLQFQLATIAFVALTGSAEPCAKHSIGIAWPTVIVLLKIYTGCAQASLIRNFHHRQPALDTRITQMACEP